MRLNSKYVELFSSNCLGKARDRFRDLSKLLLIVATACSLPAAQVNAAEPEASAQFYAGRTMEFIISAGAGGGFDGYGRLFARHFGRFLPGHPSLVPQNMIGAGGLRAATYLYNTAPRDGSSLAIIQGATLLKPLFSPDEARFDASRFTWLGNMNTDTGLCVSWHASPIKTIDDLFTREFIVAATGAGSGLETIPRVLNNVLHTRIKIISGYTGGNTTLLAIERGEVDGRCGSSLENYAVSKPEWITEKRLNVLIQLGLAKDPTLGNVPWVMDFAKTPDDRAVLELILGPEDIGRPILGPPGISPERREILRQAFDATLRDRLFLEEAQKQRLQMNPMAGSEVETIYSRLYASDQRVIRLATEALTRRDRTVQIEKAASGAE